MIILTILISILLTVIVVRRYNISYQFKREVKKLFSQSKLASNKKFNYEQLSGLPEPVQRYFKLVLEDGMPYINYVRMTHDGQFKSGADKSWSNIIGEQYATTEKPGFIWKGCTAMFTARDMYIENQGRLIVSLFSLFNIVNGSGKTFDQGELLRWLGESVLYPTNLLPSKKLQWTAIDKQTAKSTFNHNGLSLFYIVTFNDAGEIIQLESKRYMDKENLETWIIKLANYKKINRVVVPTAFEVLWRLKTGDLSYAKFNMKKIEYDKPIIF
jgi:hypothetical protein